LVNKRFIARLKMFRKNATITKKRAILIGSRLGVYSRVKQKGERVGRKRKGIF